MGARAKDGDMVVGTVRAALAVAASIQQQAAATVESATVQETFETVAGRLSGERKFEPLTEDVYLYSVSALKDPR